MHHSSVRAAQDSEGSAEDAHLRYIPAARSLQAVGVRDEAAPNCAGPACNLNIAVARDLARVQTVKWGGVATGATSDKLPGYGSHTHTLRRVLVYTESKAVSDVVDGVATAWTYISML